MTPTRRDVLRLGSLGAASVLVGGCGDNDATRDAGTDLASAVLEPESDSFLVATWSGNARSVALEVQDHDGVVLRTSAAFDDAMRATFDIQGLAAATSYQVKVTTSLGAQLVHQVRTAPTANDPRPVRLAVSADLDPYAEFDSELLDHVSAASPELFVSIGDFPYADDGPPADTLDEYRQRHLDARMAPRVRRWLSTVGVRAIYDDHEFRNDWDAMYRAAEANRYAAAMQAWDEFFPLRRNDIRYRSWRWGANVECFMLDTRQFRSANAAPDNSNKTMLGPQQLAWLLDGVRASTALFKLIFTSVPLDYGDGNDHWAAFSTERDVMFQGLVGVPGVLFVAGDQHLFAAHRHAHGIREFQVGPIARGIGNPMRTAPGVLFRSRQYNVGLIDIDDATLTFSGLGADGTLFYKETLVAEDLTPATSPA